MAESLSGVAGSLQGMGTGLLDRGKGMLDSIIPPETRNELSAKISKFFIEKPMLASFILSQVALSGPAIALFVIFTITVLVFALLVALIVAILGVVVFTVLAVGFALLFLLPTLFFTTLAASFMWAWLAGGYYILQKFNKKEIPGIHKPLGDALNIDALTGKGAPPGQVNGNTTEKDQQGEKSGGLNGVVKASGVDHPDPKKGVEMGKAAGTGDIPKLKDQAGGK